MKGKRNKIERHSCVHNKTKYDKKHDEHDSGSDQNEKNILKGNEISTFLFNCLWRCGNFGGDRKLKT